MNAKKILSRLPAYNDEWLKIKDDQYVPDIVREICKAHRLFGSYYDCFSDMFYTTSTAKLADDLYTFCKRNIDYVEETAKMQTSALPTGILTRQHGDCKHYALFTAGVIASLNRLYGRGFRWCFCFAAYEPDADEPYHVYVCLYDGADQIWVDPTPGANGQTPTLLIRKSC